MQETYYKLGIKQLENIKKPEKILLHSCCAPCSSHVISYLTKFFDITILYYNPNISPIEEYNKRKEEQIRLINEITFSPVYLYLMLHYDFPRFNPVNNNFFINFTS